MTDTVTRQAVDIARHDVPRAGTARCQRLSEADGPSLAAGSPAEGSGEAGGGKIASSALSSYHSHTTYPEIGLGFAPDFFMENSRDTLRAQWRAAYHRNKHKRYRGQMPLAEYKALRAARKAARLESERSAKKPRTPPMTPEEKREYGRQWRAANRDRMRELKRLWKAANPHHKKGRSGKSNARRREWLMKLQKGRCAICYGKLAGEVHIDHIMPLALGGPNRRSNLQLTCAPCNLFKRAKHPVDHARELGRLL